jgi:hypothetical protein
MGLNDVVYEGVPVFIWVRVGANSGLVNTVVKLSVSKKRRIS